MSRVFFSVTSRSLDLSDRVSRGKYHRPVLGPFPRFGRFFRIGLRPNEKVRFEKYKDTFKNAKEAINKMLPMVKSGELHSLIYDEGNIYISVTEEYLQSYNNDFIKFKLNDIFI